MSKIVYLILLAVFLIPAGVFATSPDCQSGGANTTGGVCTAGTGLLTGPGMMRSGSDTCGAGNASAGYCGSANGACDIGGKNYTTGDNDARGMMGGDRGKSESGYRGMMGNRAPVSATGAGMHGLFALGYALVIVLIVTWIIVGILLILALFKKLSTK